MTGTQKIRAGLVFALIVVAAALLFGWRTTFSQAATPIAGYAWSDTIGWIDLNCANTNSCGSNAFGLSVATDGTISGYAWSDNIGWVSANAADLGGCPISPCEARLTSTGLSGWLKALSGGSSQSGGWDGFISLSGPGYGVTLLSTSFQGYAWGSTVVGWVDFSLATLGVNNQCSPGNFCSGNDLYQRSANCEDTLVQACAMSCTGSFPSASCDSQCAPGYFCSGNDLYQRNAACQDSFVQACVFGCIGSSPAASCVIPLGAQFMPFTAYMPASLGGVQFQASGELEARPLLVQQGAATQLYWSTINTAACSIVGTNGFSSTDLLSGAQGQHSGALTERTTFTLNCTGLEGEILTDSVVVNIVPVLEEL